MITGYVTARREARLELTVLAPDRRVQHVDAVLDTGFNGSLTLPRDLIGALGLRRVGARPVILGDGSAVLLGLFRARLVWHGHPRDVLVLQADGAPLLGMDLLHGNRVTLDIIDGGDVTIHPLT